MSSTSRFILAFCAFSLYSCVPPPPASLYVCNGMAYDPNSYACVDYILIPKSSSSGTSSSSSEVAISSSSDISSSSSEIAASSSSNIISGPSSSSVRPTCNGVEYNSSTQFCSTDNYLYDNCGGKTYTVPKEYCHNGVITKIETGSFTDSRDGRTYKTIKLNSKTWMAKNLEYCANAEVCYDALGALYRQEKAQKACPAGWRMSTNSDWDNLVSIAGGESNAGRKLKAKKGWNNNGNGTDDYGFSALPAGYSQASRDAIPYISLVGDAGYFWSIDDNKIGHNIRRIENNKVYSEYSSNVGHYSVRCVKD